MVKATLATVLLYASALALPHKRQSTGDDDAVTCEPFYTDQQILDSLAGTYSLINTTSAQNGVPIPDEAYGENPIGIITYSRSGWMSATITATEPELRPANLSFPFRPEDSDEDWAKIGKHGVGYAGPVQVSRDIPATPTKGQVFHGPLYVANVPTWTTTNALQRRNYTLFNTPDQGKLLFIQSTRGGGFTGELWWRKID